MPQYSDSEQQLIEAMVSYAEEHSNFIRRQITELGMLGDEVFKRMWVKLANSLNDLGDYHTVDWYEKFWKKVRLENKQLMAKYLKNEARTGNLPNDIVLSDLDIRISKIYGKYGTGLAIIPEAGKSFKNNPLDLFDSVINNTMPKPTSTANVKNRTLLENISEVVQDGIIAFMAGHLQYACDEPGQNDEAFMIQEEDKFHKTMNDINGEPKRLKYWVNLWETMRRHAKPDDDFPYLVSLYMSTATRNTFQKKNAKLAMEKRALEIVLTLENAYKYKRDSNPSASNVIPKVKPQVNVKTEKNVEDSPTKQVSMVDLTMSDDEISSMKSKEIVGIDKNALEDLIQKQFHSTFETMFEDAIKKEGSFLDSFFKKKMYEMMENPTIIEKVRCMVQNKEPTSLQKKDQKEELYKEIRSPKYAMSQRQIFQDISYNATQNSQQDQHFAKLQVAGTSSSMGDDDDDVDNRENKFVKVVVSNEYSDLCTMDYFQKIERNTYKLKPCTAMDIKRFSK